MCAFQVYNVNCTTQACLGRPLYNHSASTSYVANGYWNNGTYAGGSIVSFASFDTWAIPAASLSVDSFGFDETIFANWSDPIWARAPWDGILALGYQSGAIYGPLHTLQTTLAFLVRGSIVFVSSWPKI